MKPIKNRIEEKVLTDDGKIVLYGDSGFRAPAIIHLSQCNEYRRLLEEAKRRTPGSFRVIITDDYIRIEQR